MKSPWNGALIRPDPDWELLESRLFGLPQLERLLLTLASSGIEEVLLAGASAEVIESLARSQHRDRMPKVVSAATVGPLLAIRSSALFDTRLVPWFAAQLDEQMRGILFASDLDSLPMMFSMRSDEAALRELDFEVAAREAGGPHVAPPPGHICVRLLPRDSRSLDRRNLWLLTRKPTERWHLQRVRRRYFPLTAMLANRGVTPNTVTWISFWVAVLGSISLAFGGYAGAIAGAVLLYFAWVLDTMDGALSRLTFQASAAGAKLDTDLGRIAYALTGAALGWAAFGQYGNWKQASMAALMFALGGFLSIVMGVRADRLPAASKPQGLWRLRTVVDGLLHRDNTLILLVCALANRLDIFLWLLIALLHISWIVDTAVLFKARRHGESSSPPRVPPDPAQTVEPL